MILPNRNMGDFDIGAAIGAGARDLLNNTGWGASLGNVLSRAVIDNFKTIEIRTALSPPVIMNVADLLDTTSPPSAFSKFIQPTVILTPHAGQPTIVAPYGVARNGSSLPGIAVVVMILSVGFAVGRLSKRGKNNG